MSKQVRNNLQFSDAGMAKSHKADSLTFKPDCDDGARLGDFLSRPAAIHTFNWAEGSTTLVQAQFAPWEDFFDRTVISNKLQNYARIRCKLKLKFVINASPFYFGALRVCYCPLIAGPFDDMTSATEQIKMSQMPGDFLIPGDMTSFEMECPFLWPTSWLDVGARAQFTQMGRINYVLYSKLRSASGATSSNVTVTCYAWAEEVELAGLTTGLALQSDEYEDTGVISGPASTIANVAGNLADAPVIGPLARATEIGARAVGGIASIFGFSNPPVIDDCKPVGIKSFHAFANTETSMPIDKLSIDPKNEVTVDRTAIGGGKDDPLTVINFCKKESFVTGTLWSEVYSPGTQLLAFPVTPRLYGTAPATLVDSILISSTPMSHAAMLFRRWRGTMKYKLRFIKSRYHTGRVQISWDPQGTPGLYSETTTMTRIVDLQTENEVEFEIPFKSDEMWLSTSAGANIWANTTGGTVTNDKGAYNGVVKVSVLNELTGPSVNQELDVLLFASVGDDFRLAVPNELPPWSSLYVQSQELVDISAKYDGSDVSIITVGEEVLSLRTLLHRSSYWHTQYLGDPKGGTGTFKTRALAYHTNLIPRYPLEYGYMPEGMNRASWPLYEKEGVPFQFSPNVPINWLGNCFVGYKGGLVHHFNLIRNGSELPDSFKVERDYTSHIRNTNVIRNRFTNQANSQVPDTAARIVITSTFGVGNVVVGQRGMSMTNTNTQAALSVLTPQYSNWKFRPSHITRRNKLQSKTENDSLKITVQHRCGMTSATTDDGWPMLEIFVAAAVDFDLIYFIAVPTMYSYTMPNAYDVTS